MTTATYISRRGELETYFDRTAVDAWKRLTSDAPVGRIRATVRAGRDTMRATLLSWLPADMRGLRLLDAGCGTGALAVEAARRGAPVLAIDISPTLVDLARDRATSADLRLVVLDISHPPQPGDYELLAAVPPAAAADFEAMAEQAGVDVVCVGEAWAGASPPLFVGRDGKPQSFARGAFSHF